MSRSESRLKADPGREASILGPRKESRPVCARGHTRAQVTGRSSSHHFHTRLSGQSEHFYFTEEKSHLVSSSDGAFRSMDTFHIWHILPGVT